MAGMAERFYVAIRGYYRVAIICFYVSLAAIFALYIAGEIVGDERVNSLPFIVRLPFGLVGAFAAIGILSLWLGMIWDCAITSKLPVWSRVKWLLLLVLINWLGALIYYYRVFKDRPWPESVSSAPSAPATDG
jgi:hypothetical protein